MAKSDDSSDEIRDAPVTEGPATVEVNGLRLWYSVRGRGPVCLVPSPGWGMSVDFYVETLGALSDVLTLVFIDSRGSGRSQRPLSTAEYRYADFASDLEGIRRHLGAPKIWILGHSMGGILAMRYALDHPDASAGLVLVGTFAQGDKAYGEEVARRKALRASEPWYKTVDWDAIKSDQDLAVALSDVLPLYFHDFGRMAEYRARLASTAYSSHAYRGWQDSEGGTVSLLDSLGAIQCPTLLVVGESDFVCAPMNSERIHRQVKNSEMVVLLQAGHFPWVERPAPFFQAVRDFLFRSSSRRDIA